jgi:hypothetical protein
MYVIKLTHHHVMPLAHHKQAKLLLADIAQRENHMGGWRLSVLCVSASSIQFSASRWVPILGFAFQGEITGSNLLRQRDTKQE